MSRSTASAHPANSENTVTQQTVHTGNTSITRRHGDARYHAETLGHADALGQAGTLGHADAQGHEETQGQAGAQGHEDTRDRKNALVATTGPNVILVTLII